jgi:hypothetical protein
MLPETESAIETLATQVIDCWPVHSAEIIFDLLENAAELGRVHALLKAVEVLARADEHRAAKLVLELLHVAMGEVQHTRQGCCHGQRLERENTPGFTRRVPMRCIDLRRRGEPVALCRLCVPGGEIHKKWAIDPAVPLP